MEIALAYDETIEFEEGVDYNNDVSQMTAEQYLAWVHHEANNLPDVFRADIDESLYQGRQTKYVPEIEDVASCPDHLLPSQEWEKDVIVAFSELRALLARLGLSQESRERKQSVPQLKDEAAWHRFCLGAELMNDRETAVERDRSIEESSATTMSGDIEKQKARLAKEMGISYGFTSSSSSAGVVLSADREDDEIGHGGDEVDVDEDTEAGSSAAVVYPEWTGNTNAIPTTTLLLQFDQVLTQKLLGYQVNWLDDRPAISSARGQWIYGLLARLEKPLDRNMASLVRQLYRRCCKMRAVLSVDDDTFDVQIASLNVLIAICGSYFGQGEVYSVVNAGVGLEDGAYADNEDNDEDEEEDGDDEEDGEFDDDDDDEEYEYEQIDGDEAPSASTDHCHRDTVVTTADVTVTTVAMTVSKDKDDGLEEGEEVEFNTLIDDANGDASNGHSTRDEAQNHIDAMDTSNDEDIL